MTDYSFGDVVLVGFPHTDYAKVSKRPALVIYDGEDQDILLARITSQNYSSEADYSVVDWQKAGLITESYVRLGKLATIEKRYVVRKLGQLLAYEKDSIIWEHYPFVNDETGSKPETLCLAKLPARRLTARRGTGSPGIYFSNLFLAR